MFLILWSLGFRKQREEWSLAERQRTAIRSDISWFAQVDGYPELVYKDPKLVRALTAPDRVTVYRVKEGGDLRLAGYGLGSAVEVSEDHAEYFSKVVCSPTSMTGLSACVFSPGFAIRFDHGGNPFTALVCYSCRDILFFDSMGEQVAGWGMTYESAFALIHRFHDLFPDDAGVKNIRF